MSYASLTHAGKEFQRFKTTQQFKLDVLIVWVIRQNKLFFLMQEERIIV